MKEEREDITKSEECTKIHLLGTKCAKADNIKSVEREDDYVDRNVKASGKERSTA